MKVNPKEMSAWIYLRARCRHQKNPTFPTSGPSKAVVFNLGIVPDPCQSVNLCLFIVDCHLNIKQKKIKIIQILSNTTKGLQRKTTKGHLVSHNLNSIFKRIIGCY